MTLSFFTNWPLAWWLAGCFLLGLLLGSFLNLVAYRLPLMLLRQWGDTSAELTSLPARFNLSLPASHCPSCQANLRWWQNLPVVSYLMLRGKCAACGVAIPISYLLVEVASACLLLALGSYYVGSLEFFIWGYFVLSLLVLALIDARTKLLPDILTLPLMWAGLVFHWWFSSPAVFNQVFLGAILGYLSLFSIYWLFKLLTGKEGMGYGDFKFLAALGAWLGAPALVPLILLAAGLGLLVVLGLKLGGKWRGQALPFGPALALAGLAIFFGRWPLAEFLGLASWLEITGWLVF